MFHQMKRKKVKWLSRVQLFANPWTVAGQAPPTMGSAGKNTGVEANYNIVVVFGKIYIYIQ